VSRSIEGENQAFLGVQPRTASGGVAIDEVTPGSAADLAGLFVGDVIISMDGNPVADVTQLVNQIRMKRPGDKIQIVFHRNGHEKSTFAKLAGRDITGERAARFKMMSRLGAIPSKRSDNFPFVFQHDIPLFPEQCGGPVCDLQGNAVGINIARASRAASYAIPANHVETILSELMQPHVASRNVNSN
jgi:serine protease Do